MSIRDLVLAKLEELPETLLQEVNQAIDKIIDQNLAYLNSRLDEYLTILNLQHRVKFANDLSV